MGFKILQNSPSWDPKSTKIESWDHLGPKSQKVTNIATKVPQHGGYVGGKNRSKFDPRPIQDVIIPQTSFALMGFWLLANASCRGGRPSVRPCPLILLPGPKGLALWPYLISQVQNPISSTHYLVSSMRYSVSSTQYPVSSIQCPSIQYPISSIQYPVSSVQHPISNIQYLVSNI